MKSFRFGIQRGGGGSLERDIPAGGSAGQYLSFHKYGWMAPRDGVIMVRFFYMWLHY